MKKQSTEKMLDETVPGFSGDRRNLLIGAGALSLGALVAAAGSHSAFAGEHGHHHATNKNMQH